MSSTFSYDPPRFTVDEAVEQYVQGRVTAAQVRDLGGTDEQMVQAVAASLAAIDADNAEAVATQVVRGSITAEQATQALDGSSPLTLAWIQEQAQRAAEDAAAE